MSYIGSKPASKPVVASDLDPTIITGQTAIGATPADTDELIISDAGVLKRMDYSHIKGGGKVGQVVSTTKTDTFTSNSQTFTDVTGMSVAITPSASSSKVLVFAKVSCGQASGNNLMVKLLRDSTDILVGDAASNRIRTSAVVYSHSSINAGPIYGQTEVPILYLDSPSSTSELTYKIQFKQGEDLTGALNASADDSDNASRPRTASTITVMEVLA